MASEYSVNIKLNTSEVKKDLKTIGTEISNLGRKTTGSKKRILTTDADDQLLRDLGIKTRKFARTINPILNKADKVAAKGGMLALPDSKMLNAQVKGIKRLETSADITAKHAERKAKAEERSAKFSTEAMKANQASAKAGVAHARKLARMSGDTGFTAAQFGPQLPMQGPRMFGQAFDPTGGSSALNFSRSGRLLQGPAGSSPNTFGNLRRRFGPRRGFDFGSAAISGGFPLLFGQGPIGAIAGGLGGGIGGMFGQMGGFAGGIAATALVQQVQTFIDSTSKLGQAMSSLTPDTNALAQAMGIVGTQEEKRIQAIEKLNGKQAALTAAMDKMRETIGDKEVDRLKAFGETTRLIGNEFAIAMTKMQAFGVRFINLFDKIFGLSASAEKSQRDRAIENSTNPEILRIQSEIEEVKKGRMRGSRRDKRLKVLRDELKVLGDQEVKTNKIAAKNETDRLTLEASLRATTDKTKLLQDTLQFGEQEAQIRQRILQFERDSGVVLDANGKKRIRDAMELERSLQRQVDFTKAIGASFRDSFRDAITGATSFGQAMSNVLNTIRDRLINMYLDQMFAQATMGRKGGGGIFGNLLGGLLGGVFGGGGFSITGGATNTALTSAQQIAKDTAMYGNTFPAGSFANGGFAQRGKSYLVGERGPELFTPGATGGQISPMGSTNIVVNVDASGSSVEGNESESQVLGQVLASAIQSELIKQKRPGGLLG